MPTLGDKRLALRSARLLRDFAALPPVSPDHAATLLRVIDSSPLIRWQLNRTTHTGELTEFSVLPDEINAGGSYDADARQISIPLRMLTREREPEIAFVLGHELQHALASADFRRSIDQFFAAVEVAAHENYDYTAAIGGYLGWRRDDEATANLVGWNAMVDWVDDRLPDASLEDVVLVGGARTSDFVDPRGFSFQTKPLLIPRPDLRFELTRDNVEAMARYYYDKPPSELHLGSLGTSDYRNQYGSWAVMQAAACHRFFTRHLRSEPTMIINATELGLSRQIMEQNGIDLAGRPQQPYLDRSTEPETVHYLHHTIRTHRYAPLSTQPSSLSRGDSTSAARRATPRESQGRGR